MPHYKGEIVVPTPNDSGAEEVVLASIEHRLVDEFDGYSRYDGTGGWESENGVVEEPHVRLTATGESDTIEEVFREEARRVKRELGEDAVFIQFTPVTMELV